MITNTFKQAQDLQGDKPLIWFGFGSFILDHAVDLDWCCDFSCQNQIKLPIKTGLMMQALIDDAISVHLGNSSSVQYFLSNQRHSKN